MDTTIYKPSVVDFLVSQNGKYRIFKYMQLYNFTRFCLYIYKSQTQINFQMHRDLCLTLSEVITYM
jgi:hypothetical protein